MTFLVEGDETRRLLEAEVFRSAKSSTAIRDSGEKEEKLGVPSVTLLIRDVPGAEALWDRLKPIPD